MENNRFLLARVVLTILAFIQGSAQLLKACFSGNDNQVIKVWISIGDSICNNWIAFSVFLLFAAIGYIYYETIFFSDENVSVDEVRNYKKAVVKTILLVIINLILCNQIYSTDSLSAKAQYLQDHVEAVVICTVIFAAIVIALLFICHEKKVRSDIDKMKGQSVANTENGESEDGTIDVSKLAEFKLSHPISYAFRSLIDNRTEMQKLRAEREKKYIELRIKFDEESHNKKIKELQNKDISKANSTMEDPREDIFIKSSAIISMLISLALAIFLLVLYQRNITDGLYNWLKNMGELSELAAKVLQEIGKIFLIVVVYFATYLIIYLIFRVTVYLYFHHSDDENIIANCAKAIKTIVFLSIKSGLRLIIFIPDFIEETEKVLLNSDMDAKIKEMYPDVSVSAKSADDSDESLSS